jgi:hypothetical protein
MKRYPQALGVVHGFSEANQAVFQNAGLWKLKRNHGTVTWAYAPSEYLGLFWSADHRRLISPSPYASVMDVYMTQVSEVSRKRVSTWFSSGSRNYLRNLVLELLPASVFHKLPLSLKHDYKSRKFLIESGAYLLCKQNFLAENYQNRRDSKFIGTGAYTSIPELRNQSYDLREHFQTNFEILRDQIASSTLAPFGSDYLSIDSAAWERDTVTDFLEWRQNSDKIVFLRTRNIQNNVAFQNARSDFLRPIILRLLSEGINVVNSGVPPVPLSIANDRYLEFSHDLPVDIELSLAADSDYVMNTAWAGLFTAVSTLSCRLITFDEEWSVHNLANPISLLEARRDSGKEDVILGNSIYTDDEKVIVNRILKGM